MNTQGPEWTVNCALLSSIVSVALFQDNNMHSVFSGIQGASHALASPNPKNNPVRCNRHNPRNIGLRVREIIHKTSWRSDAELVALQMLLDSIFLHTQTTAPKLEESL